MADNVIWSLCNTLEQFSAIADDHGEERFLISFKVEEVNELLHHLYRLENIVDKYRWHDLRKNPDDLPECDNGDMSCDVLFSDGNIVYLGYTYKTYSGFTDEPDELRWCAHDWTINDVIAWRYIEPFEEADE